MIEKLNKIAKKMDFLTTTLTFKKIPPYKRAQYEVELETLFEEWFKLYAYIKAGLFFDYKEKEKNAKVY
jgi:hypothetical protein